MYIVPMTDTAEYDVFLSHASEDKDAVARPLAEALKAAGLRVWYDEHMMMLGDNLRRSIDEGLSKSRFGVVILSNSFFNKQWPERELDGLTALEMGDGRKRIIPIWHGVGQAEVAAHSAPLAGILAASSSEGLQLLVRKILVATMKDNKRLPPVYDFFHENKEIDLVSLAREKGSLLEGYYFKNCTFLGPAVLMIMSNTAIDGIGLRQEQLWPMDEGRGYVGGIGALSCRLEHCNYEQIGVALSHQWMARLPFLVDAD